MARELQRQLQSVAARVRQFRGSGLFERVGWLGAIVGAVCYGLARLWPGLMLPLLGLFFAVTLTALVRGLRDLLRWRTEELKRTAQALEAKYPELQTRLLTAVEQQPDVLTGRFHLLQTRLMSEVAEHARAHDWKALVPQRALTRAVWRQWIAALAMCVSTLALLTLPKSSAETTGKRHAGGAAAGDARTDYTVDPGDADVERNQSLLVLIRFRQAPPRDVTMHWQPVKGPAQSLAMTRSLDDPVFAGRLAAVSQSGTYQLEFDGVTTPAYAVKVYDLPALVHSSLTVIAPGYTHREPQVFSSASSVTIIEGSEVRLTGRVNKELARAELRNDQDQSVIPLTAEGATPLDYAAQWSPERSGRWLLTLTDADGRTNRDPQEFQIDVAPNRRPELKPVFPGQDLRVSPLQEIGLELRASDDFGLLATGLVVDPAGGEPVAVTLTGPLAGGEAHPLTHLLSLEPHALEPGQVVSYAFFADDHGPDGNARRTMSDLFFLEIRPFEETYRQMEGAGGNSNMQGSSSSPGQTLDKLIDLQKQIVSGTWNLQRRDPDLKQPEEQAAVDTLLESQTSAHEQFELLAEGLEGAVPADRIRVIFENMSRAVDELTAVQTSHEPDHLDGALRAARGAFQGLVRLRPTDHRIMQGGQSGGGAGGGGSTSQQQLDQLELSDDANRYETEKSARNQADSSQQREQLAFLNRLKELARRQQGLNEKLKELDAELRTAQTEAQRAELERQLKQLRDEQQDMLQDADALRNKLEQAKNPEQTADARKQLEQTRRQLVDAAESLKEGKLGQALSSGTRAEKDLERLQDDFRKQTSARLAEALQQLRNQARELTETEEKAAKDLAALGDQQQKSLRQRQQREQLAQTFQEQRDELDKALQSIRETVQAAESSEPLAAKRLYEAARQAQQQKTDQALTAASQLVRQGFLPEATQVEEMARKGLQTLRDGIEEASESILGDELTDLKRAKRELAELAQELQQEIASAQGEKSQGEKSDGESEPGEGTPGKSSEPSDQPSKGGGEQPGQTPGDGKAGAEGESSEGTGEGSESSSPGESAGGEGSESSAGGKAKSLRGGKKKNPPGSQRPGPGQSQPGQSDGGQSGGPGGQGGPLTGGNYSDFVERLRDVETLLNDPELQAEVSKVREQARSVRAEFKRHSQLPNWNVVEEDVRQPLVELQKRIAEEIARRESPEALVPTDRDPVPQRYRELVRKYYERLGGGGQ